MNQITVAAAIIVNEYNQLLLVRKKATEYFMQVGGKLEPTEQPEQTMLREIEEEIGTKATLKSFVGRFETQAANEKDHLLVSYVYHVSINSEPQIHAEIAEMKWIDLDADQTLLAPLTTQVVIPWCKENLTDMVTA